MGLEADSYSFCIFPFHCSKWKFTAVIDCRLSEVYLERLRKLSFCACCFCPLVLLCLAPLQIFSVNGGVGYSGFTWGRPLITRGDYRSFISWKFPFFKTSRCHHP